MSFLETPRFPECVRYGYTNRSQWSETISEYASGQEDRNRNWLRSKKVFNVTIGPKAAEAVIECYEFWEALAGPDCGFRFKDVLDYKSCRVTQQPAATDQALVLIPGSPGGYQLQKTYRKGTRATVRNILKPVEGTIRVADGGVVKTEGSDWVLEYTTGLMTVFFSPSGLVTWGGEFDTPVRFNSEFPVELISQDVQSVTFELIELKNPRTEE
jgi:uncharacterized protein (TIGR02217 family)